MAVTTLRHEDWFPSGTTGYRAEPGLEKTSRSSIWSSSRLGWPSTPRRPGFQCAEPTAGSDRGGGARRRSSTDAGRPSTGDSVHRAADPVPVRRSTASRRCSRDL